MVFICIDVHRLLQSVNDSSDMSVSVRWWSDVAGWSCWWYAVCVWWQCYTSTSLGLYTDFSRECASPVSVHSAFVHTSTVSVLLPWVCTLLSYILCRECASPVSVHSAFVHTLSWVCFSRECKLGFVHTLPYVWMRSQTMWQFDSDTETISASRHCSRHLEMWTDKLEVISSAILYMICCHYTML